MVPNTISWQACASDSWRLSAEMSVRARLAELLVVSLRVPPLFVVDELLKLSLGLPIPEDDGSYGPSPASPSDEGLPLANVTVNLTEAFDALRNLEQQDEDIGALFVVGKFILCCIGCMLSMSVFLLHIKHLIITYMYLISVGLIFTSYWTNVAATKQIIALSTESTSVEGSAYSILEDYLNLNFNNLLGLKGASVIIFQNYLLQFILGTLFYNSSLGPKHTVLQYLLPWSFTIPSIIAMLPFSNNVLHHSPVFAALVPLAIAKYVICSSMLPIGRVVYDSYHNAKNFASNFGLSALIEFEWSRLNVPCVLRVFWITRVIEHAGLLLMETYDLTDPNFTMSTLLAVQNLASMTKSLLVSGCETVTAVLGMTSIISFFCHYIGNFFQWILMADDDEDRNIGTVSAILFYILSLQTGLTSLNPEKRFVRLCRNFFLLFAALLHFIHNIVSPLLLSLSASHNMTAHRHVRALGVCAFLVIFPIILLLYLWSNHALSTWLLAVSAFSIEVIVKVAVSLMIYSLFLIDAYRTTFWEKLDDYVYYIRAFGNTVEFCFGIFLFFNGAWILLFESGGAIRALMMCIHAYFNIWCEARAGWSTFIKRRTAVIKIESLPEASQQQLTSLDDVCAICYQEMNSAKITRCNHYFHGVCLRKWLYVQDRCPLCHEILYKTGSEAASENADDNIQNENIVEEQDNAR